MRASVPAAGRRLRHVCVPKNSNVMLHDSALWSPNRTRGREQSSGGVVLNGP